MAQLIKQKNQCANCDTKYIVEWDLHIQDLKPITCPFCGHETEDLTDYEDTESRFDNWD
jgi:DNA-directed RNA polymerase subunit RPC12/RpoP|tara:strand:+ start:7691 stop:7867 length:177 start_codon:yes stop_codon:yes gene_type:complete